jgi:catalase
MSTSATPEPVIRQIVEAMRTLAGPHPGFRPVHAKGLVCSGTFRASADAPRVTRAPHFTGQSVPTIVRFANANGNPDVHDGVPSVRSMAVKFQLSDGKSADILPTPSKGSSRGRPRSFSSSCGRSCQIRPAVSPTPMRFRAFSPAIPPDAPSSSA